MTDFRVSQEGILGGYSGSGTAVTVPSTVSAVGYAAFRNMPVTSVTLPAATTEIRAAAFAGCSQLSSVTVPDTLNIKFIARDAFDGTQVLSQPYNPQISASTIRWSIPSNTPRTISSYTLHINGLQSTVGDASMNLSQLTNGITNVIQIAANDATGEGIWSPPLSFASTGMPWETSDTISCAPAVVACSAIGNRIAVADVSSSAVAIYDLQSNETWSLTETISGTGRVLSIAMGTDGKTVVVARSTDVRIYTETTGVWSEVGTLAHPNGCVALSVDGQTLAVGNPAGDGAVSLYRKRSGTWTLQKTLYGTMDSAENFGCSVALSADAGVVAVGAKYALGKGAVRIFSGSQWKTQTNLYGEEGSSEQFGSSVALSADGRTLAVGSPCMGTLNAPTGAMAGHGRVTVWSKPVATWTKVTTLYGADGSTDLFGSSVTLNAAGTTLLVSSGSGARIYAENAGAWPIVGAFTEAAGLGAVSNTGDRVFCGSASALKSYTYRTARMNVVPSVTTLLSAIRVQNAATAETAAQNLIADLVGFEQASDIILSADFIAQFAAALPTDSSKKQATLAALLIAGNLLTETQNDLKAAIKTACTSTLQFAADSYIGISPEYISTIIQSSDHLDSYNPTSLYVYFPSSTSITVSQAYENVIFYLEPGVTYTAGSTTLNYRRRSELQRLLLSLPNSATFTAPFRSPNPFVPLFSPVAQRYRLENQYGQDSLIESATYWQHQAMASPVTYFNYEMLAWIAVDMLLSADTTTRQIGTALAAKFLPIARGLQTMISFNDGGDDATLESLPTGYFVAATDGSVAYPETLVLTHSAPLKRIDAGAFDSTIRTVVINGQTFTVQNGNITLPYNASRIWSINVNGPQILLPGAPTHIPAGGLIDISANIAYIPPGYFADCSASHVRFEVGRSTDMQVIGAGAFPATCRLYTQFYDPSLDYYQYNTNGTNLKELTRLSGIFYSDFETELKNVWSPLGHFTTDETVIVPLKQKNMNSVPASRTKLLVESDSSLDMYYWSPRIVSNELSKRFLQSKRVIYENLEYTQYGYSFIDLFPRLTSVPSTVKLLVTYHHSGQAFVSYTLNGITIYSQGYDVQIADLDYKIPSFLKNNTIKTVIIPYVNDWDLKFLQYSGTSPYRMVNLTKNEYYPREKAVNPVRYVFTNADLTDGQVFYYGNLGWTNSADSSGLRIREVLTSPATGGAVFLMPGAHSLYANMFGHWAPSVTEVKGYYPNKSIVTSVPAYTFKECINLATHGFVFRDSIGVSAFENCSLLTTPVVASSTGGITINTNAFKSCVAIPSITIDCSGTVSIAENAFKGCVGLTNVTISGSTINISDNAFKDCSGITSITLISDTTINLSENVFKGCTDISSITIRSNNSVIISSKAFLGCNALTSLTIDCNGTVSFESDTFSGCTGITSITLRGSIVNIPSAAFSDCNVLVSFVIGNTAGSSVINIASTAFRNCSSITSITIRGSTVSIDPAAFTGCTGVQSILVTGLTSSSPFPFTTMTGLQTVQIATAGAVSLSTMTGLTLLTAVTLTGSSALTIASDQFNGCSALQTLTISNPLAGMTTSALAGCAALQSLLLTFGTGAIANINALTSSTALTTIQISGGGALTLPDSFCNGLTALTSVSLLTSNTLVVPSSGNMFSGTSALQTFTAVAANPSNVTFQISGTLSALKTLSITGGITVAGGAFWANSVLESLTIRGMRDGTLGTLPSATIRYINVNHAANQTIFAYQYANWPALENVSITPLMDISEGAFFGCTKLQTFNFDVTESIGSWAFAKSGLSGEVVIPNTTIFHGDDYFIGCPNLKTIKYYGDLRLFEDPTVLRQNTWKKLNYKAEDSNGLVIYDVSGIATVNRGTDLSFNIIWIHPFTSSDEVIDNSSFFKTMNWNNFTLRTSKINDLLQPMMKLYDICDNFFESLTVSRESRAWIYSFILEFQDLARKSSSTKNVIDEFGYVAGFNGTRFANMDASASSILTPAAYTIYENKMYPTIIYLFSDALKANFDLFDVAPGASTISIDVPCRIPGDNPKLKLPQLEIDKITNEATLEISGSDVYIVWPESCPSIILDDNTVIDIKGSLRVNITQNASANFKQVALWIAQNIDALSEPSSVAFVIENTYTSINDLSNKINTSIDISCGILTIYDSAMMYLNNTNVTISVAGISIGNGAFNNWSSGSTLNLSSSTNPCVGIDVFNGSNNITINSTKFLINTPNIRLVDFSNVSMENVPAIIEQYTDISASNTREVEIGTYLPATEKGFPKGLAYIKFQELPSLQLHILLQKPEDWFWARHQGTDSVNSGTVNYNGFLGDGQMHYMNGNNNRYDEHFLKCGLVNSFAPDSFTFMGYSFRRNVGKGTLSQPNTYFYALKTDNYTVKRGLYTNSPGGRLLGFVGPLIIQSVLLVLVAFATAGIGVAALAAAKGATATAIAVASTAIIGAGLEVGAAFLGQATSTAFTTGVFELGELTPLFWVEIGLSAASAAFGIVKLLRLIKIGPKPIPWEWSKPTGTSVTKQRKWPPHAPREKWGVPKSFERPPPIPVPPIKLKIISVFSEIITDGGKFVDDAPMNQLDIVTFPPTKPKPGTNRVIAINQFISNVRSSARKLDDIGEEIMSYHSTLMKLDNVPGKPPAPPRIIKQLKKAEAGNPDRILLAEKALGAKYTHLAKLDNPTDITNAQIIIARDRAKFLELKGLLPKTMRTIQDTIKKVIKFLLIDWDNFMISTGNNTSALISYLTAKDTIANYSVFTQPTQPVTLNQYAEYTSQTLLPILAVGGESRENCIGKEAHYETSYLDAYLSSSEVQNPPYIFPTAVKPSFNVNYNEAPYHISHFLSCGTNYKHPYTMRAANGYPCRPAITASPLLTRTNYLWEGVYIGERRTINNLEYNPVYPGNMVNSYDGKALLTIGNLVDKEIYLGYRTVEYTASVLEAPNLVYSGATNISIVIPNTVTSIPDYAFNGTSDTLGVKSFTLSSVFIPPSVTSIGKQAFYRSGLKSLVYPIGVSIADYAFANMGLQQSIATPTNAQITLYDTGNINADMYTPNVTNLNITFTKNVIGIQNFNYATISSISDVLQGANNILYFRNPKYIFINNYQPTRRQDLIYYWDINSIDNLSFTNGQLIIRSNNWNYIYRPIGLSIISIFGSSSIMRINGTINALPRTIRTRDTPVVNIAPHAFMGNESLTHCDISPYCTEIGESAFQGCESLRELVVLPDGLVKLGANAFAGTNIAGIVIPSTVTEIEAGAIPPTANIVLLPNESDEISPGFLTYSAEHMAETNTVFCASASVLRRLARTLPHPQLRLDRAPVQPVNVTVAPSDGCVSLTWSNVDVPYSSGATSYRVECTAEGETAQVFECVSSPYTVTQLTNGVEYTFAVTAVNGAGNSGSTTVQATPVGASTIKLEVSEIIA